MGFGDILFATRRALRSHSTFVDGMRQEVTASAGRKLAA
jgi:hypothetical protein